MNSQLTRETYESDEWQYTLNTHITNKTHDFIHNIMNFKDTICADLTGKFQVQIQKRI